MARKALDVTKLKAATAGTKNPVLVTLVAEVEAYNKLAATPTVGPARLIEHLDTAMVNAATWLTSKPKTGTDKNKDRRKALHAFAREASAAFLALGVRPLHGDWKDGEDNYWLERVDPRHRPGYATSPYYLKYLEDASDETFWDYLDEKVPSLSAKAINAGWELYFDQDHPELKNSPQVDKDAIKKIGVKLSGLAKNVQQLAANARAQFIVKPENGHLADANGEAFCTKTHRTVFSGPGWAIFVVDAKNTMYAASHAKGEFHHSSFLGGAPVKTAGEVVADEAGKVVIITPKSGHYRPDLDSLQPFTKHLQLSQVLHAKAIVRLGLDPKGASASCLATDFIAKGAEAPPLPVADAWKLVPKWAQNDALAAKFGIDTTKPASPYGKG